MFSHFPGQFIVILIGEVSSNGMSKLINHIIILINVTEIN